MHPLAHGLTQLVAYAGQPALIAYKGIGWDVLPAALPFRQQGAPVMTDAMTLNHFWRLVVALIAGLNRRDTNPHQCPRRAIASQVQ